MSDRMLIGGVEPDDDATDKAYVQALVAEVERLRRIEAKVKAITGDALSPWGMSAYEDYWQCDYCQGRCDDTGDEPGDWGHTEHCPWMALRRDLHPDSVAAASDRLDGEAVGE